MKHVAFRSIRLEGFKSYASPAVFQFGSTGLYLIKGNNGEGKTSLFSALVWCLYKTNLNNTNNTRIPTFKWKRGKSYIGTRVMLTFNVGSSKYLVARHMDYKGKTKGLDGDSSLLIFCKDKTDKNPFTAKDIVNNPLYKSDAQTYLNTLLGIDSKTFLNSVVFGQRMTRLMDSKNEDKRELFEKLFDVSFIDTLKDKATDKFNKNNSALNDLKQECAGTEAAFNQLTRAVSNAADIVAEFKQQRKLRLAEIRVEFEDKKVELAETEEQIKMLTAKVEKSDNTVKLNELLAQADEKREALSDVKARLRHVQDDAADMERQLSNCELEMNNFKTKLSKVSDICPTCGGPLDAKQVKATKKTLQDAIDEGKEIQEHYTSKIRTLQESEKAIAQEVKVANNVLSVFMGAYEEAKIKGVGCDSTESSLNIATRRQAVLTAAIETLAASHAKEKERQPPSVKVEELKAELDKVTLLKAEKEKAIRVHTNLSIRLEWWVKNAFGAGGLKAYVFSAMLNRLNEYLATYTEYFGYTVIFGIDLTKPSKPFYCKVTLDGEHELEYADLSGGQKQKIDLCIAFAMSDAIVAKTSFNICIFDECAEGLDMDAQEALDTLLRIKAERKGVYVISHSPQLDLSGAIIYEVSGGNKETSIIQ